MYDLAAFRNRVREHTRRATPYDDNRKPSLADLASAIGLSRGELSYRLNGTNKAKLTRHDARAIMRTLAEWGALTTRAEATELLALVGFPPPTAAEWEAPPLDALTAPPPVASASAPVNRMVRVEQRVIAVRPAAHQPESNRMAVGRVHELAALTTALAQHSCVAITGGGGMGKSTFAAMYIEGGGYSATCWRNLHHNPSFADFTLAALSSLGLYFDPSAMPRPQDQANYLASVLRGNPDLRQLLVLNNFESVLGADGVEAGWQELLELAIAGLGHSRVLITTRELPYTRQGREPYRYPMPPLTPADGVALLVRLGVQAAPDELVQAVKLAGGHPLALIFLADLSHNQGYSVAALLKETAWSERIAERFLDRIYRQLSPAAQTALCYFSIFEGPTNPANVAGMLAHLSPPATDWDEAAVHQQADQLAMRSLLDNRGGEYQLHPIVREYAYHRLADARTYHHAAARYFQSRYPHDPTANPPLQLAEVQPLLDAFDHFCAAADYEAACAVFTMQLEHMSGEFFNRTYMLLNRWGEYARTAAMARRLAEADATLLSDTSRCRAFNALSIAYRNLGEYQQAIDVAQQGLALAEAMDDAGKQAYFLSNIAVAYEWLKDYPRAIDYTQRTLAIAQPAAMTNVEGTSWTSLGNIYTQLGDFPQALANHQQAYAISQQLHDESGIVTDLLNLGEVSDALGDRPAAVAYYRQALARAEQLGHLEGQATLWYKAGLLCAADGRSRDALACFLKCMQLRERIGNAEEIEQARERIAAMRTALPALAWRTLFAEAERLAADVDWRPWGEA